MLVNRSIPQFTVIPEIPYPDIGNAIAWLCDTFGFTIRIRVGNHRAQLNVGDGAVALIEQLPGTEGCSSSVMIRVEDAYAHHQRAVQQGARVLRAPADYPYGERQYTIVDFAGHRWTFTQSIADVDPKEWGGTPGRL
jgi:uncharacterized glyoxalase superfamily protein PhnB